MVDPLAVQRRLELLEQYRARLSWLSTLPADDYADRRFEARYLVQTAAQICVDLANHVIASSGWPAARDQFDAFSRLAEHDVLGPALAERLGLLSGLRNLLVHVYADIDDDRVRRALGDGLGDLDSYARAIAGCCDAGPLPTRPRFAAVPGVRAKARGPRSPSPEAPSPETRTDRRVKVREWWPARRTR